MFKVEIQKKSITIELFLIVIIFLFSLLPYLVISKVNELLAVLILCFFMLGPIILLSIKIRRNNISHIEVDNNVFSVYYKNGKRKSVTMSENTKPEIWYDDYNGKLYGYIKVKGDNQRIFLRRDLFIENDFKNLISTIERYSVTKPSRRHQAE